MDLIYFTEEYLFNKIFHSFTERSNAMISVMNGINASSSFGFPGGIMDTKPFYHKFAAANVGPIACSIESDRNHGSPVLSARYSYYRLFNSFQEKLWCTLSILWRFWRKQF